jgi:hypothetical protein
MAFASAPLPTRARQQHAGDRSKLVGGRGRRPQTQASLETEGATPLHPRLTRQGDHNADEHPASRSSGGECRSDHKWHESRLRRPSSTSTSEAPKHVDRDLGLRGWRKGRWKTRGGGGGAEARAAAAAQRRPPELTAGMLRWVRRRSPSRLGGRRGGRGL